MVFVPKPLEKLRRSDEPLPRWLDYKRMQARDFRGGRREDEDEVAPSLI